jgi:hypothetical protein
MDPLGSHLCTRTAHSGAKKAHNWAVDQIANLFRTNHNVKTQRVASSRGQRCGDIELASYLANVAGPVPLCWISASLTTVLAVALTLVLMDTYITRMM